MTNAVVKLYTVPECMSHWAVYAWGFQSAMPQVVQQAIGLRYHTKYPNLTETQKSRIAFLDEEWTRRFEAACRADCAAFAPALEEEWGDPASEGVFDTLWSESITAPEGLDVDAVLLRAEVATSSSRDQK